MLAFISFFVSTSEYVIAGIAKSTFFAILLLMLWASIKNKQEAAL
jgi:hypothetical protein